MKLYMKRAWHIGVSSLSGAIDGVLPSSNKRRNSKALIFTFYVLSIGIIDACTYVLLIVNLCISRWA